MKSKKIFLNLLSLSLISIFPLYIYGWGSFSISTGDSETSINGKIYKCDGSIFVNNNKVTCNGKVISGDGATVSEPCGGSPTRKPAIGNGQVDVNATVSPEARIDGTVCGAAVIEKSVVVQDGASINGPIKIGKNSVIKRGATLNGGGTIGAGVTINENVTLNGNINLKNANVAKGTRLNGNINIDGVVISGDMSCSGDGSIRAASSTEVRDVPSPRRTAPASWVQ